MRKWLYKDASREFVAYAHTIGDACELFAKVLHPLDTSRVVEIYPEEEVTHTRTKTIDNRKAPGG